MRAESELQQWDPPLWAAGLGSPARTIRVANALIALEDEGVRRDFPGFKRMPSIHGTGIWRGQLRPFTQTFDVVVDMGVACRDADIFYPWRVGSVRVLGGAVKPSPNGVPVPHLYNAWNDPNGARLCLYYPPDEQMVEGYQVSQKLIRWAFKWLHFYELWLITGDWTGPEAPHDPADWLSSNPRPIATPSGSVKRTFDDPVMRTMTYLICRNHPIIRSPAELFRIGMIWSPATSYR